MSEAFRQEMQAAAEQHAANIRDNHTAAHRQAAEQEHRRQAAEQAFVRFIEQTPGGIAPSTTIDDQDNLAANFTAFIRAQH